MTQYANDWVQLYTRGRGNFVMTNMEDSGFTEALTRLDKMHRVDFARVMVLRTGSNDVCRNREKRRLRASASRI